MIPKPQIGKLKLKNRIFLSPMEEVNDIAFRLLCKQAGAGLTYTGLFHPLSKQKFYTKDKPGFQLFCNSTKGLTEFIKKYDKKVSLWDFNLGCPVLRAKKAGYGAYLTDLKVIEEILKTMREATKKPVTVKIRKSKIAFDILKLAEKYCDAIAIHARTKEKGYAGEPDLDFALKIKLKTKLPVIYSGNVNERNAEGILKQFDFVMIGREAIGHPEIFANLTGNKKFKRDYKNYLKLAKKFDLPFKQLKFQAMQFTKGLRGCKQMRDKIAQAKSYGELL